MQRTLKREFKELEIVKRETIEVSYSTAAGEIQLAASGFGGRWWAGPRACPPRPPSEPRGAGALFPGACEPASVSPFVPPLPPREVRSKGRLKACGVQSTCPLGGGDTRTDLRRPGDRGTQARALTGIGDLVPLPGSGGSAREGRAPGAAVRAGASKPRCVRWPSGPPALVSPLFLGCLGLGLSRQRARDAGALKRASTDPS